MTAFNSDGEQKLHEESAVDSFAVLMKTKLEKHRGNNSNSWCGPGTTNEGLIDTLDWAVGDGDWVSVANYAMMIHDRQAKGLK